MKPQSPDIHLLLAACLSDCHALAESQNLPFSQPLRELTPSEKLGAAFNPRVLHDLLSGSGEEPQQTLLQQATAIVKTNPNSDVLTIPLDSVVKRIVLEQSFPEHKELFYKQTRWSDLSDIFPTSDKSEVKSRDILEGFLERWLDFAGRAAAPDALLAGTFALIDEWLWCIPADEKQPDVPLSEILRLKSAVAACLWQRQNADSPPKQSFRVVSGDLSGIQQYLFGITEGGKSESGTGKRLRARSLFVQLLAEVGIWKTLSEYNLPVCNVLMASGGKFMLLCPNLREFESILTDLRTAIDGWLLEHLHGAIGLSLASVEMAEAELRQGFGRVIDRVEKELFREKHRPLCSHLQSDGGWNEAAFLIQEEFKHEVCPSCQTFPRSGPNMFCQHCQNDADIGKMMAHHPRWLALFRSAPESVKHSLSVLGVTVQVLEQEQDIRPETDLLLQLGGALELTSSATHYPILWRQSAPYVNQHLSFSPMAHRGEGRALLGYLKADADHLGKAFQWGFYRDAPEQGFDTPARFSAFSHHLERFFGGWLSQFLKQHYSESYTVFSGGDDLFIIGHWNSMLTCAQDIQAHFRQFCGEHPSLTLSAGIAMVKEKYPLAHAAGDAEKLVESAKKEAALERTDGKGRHQIALLGDVLTWERFEDILLKRTTLEREQPRSAFLYQLLQYADMWRQFNVEHKTEGLRFQPLLAYTIKRNVNQRKQPELRAWAERLVQIVLEPDARDELDHLGLLATLVIFARSGE